MERRDIKGNEENCFPNDALNRLGYFIYLYYSMRLRWQKFLDSKLKHLVIDCFSEQFLLKIIERCSSLKTLNEQDCKIPKEKLEASLNQITQPINTAPQLIPAPQQRVTKPRFGKKILGTLTLLGKNKPLSQNSSSN